MFCVSCGGFVGDDFRFCEFCGMPNADYFEKEEAQTEEKREITPPDLRQTEEAVTRGQSTDKLTCLKCGYELKENSKFCERCGAPVESKEQPVPQIIKCRCCGRELEAGSLFCDKCGMPVSQNRETPAVRRCKACGFEIEEDFVFCDRCGAKQ